MALHQNSYPETHPGLSITLHICHTITSLIHLTYFIFLLYLIVSYCGEWVRVPGVPCRTSLWHECVG